MTQPDVPVDVACLRRLLAEATPGPWTHRWMVLMADDIPLYETPHMGDMVLSEVDAALIVAMHEALPQLLERIEELEDAIESMDHARDCRGFMHADGRVWKPCNCARALLGSSSSPLGAET